MLIDVSLTPGIWFVLIVLAALVDYLVGDPVFLVHPVTLIGKLISILTRILNRGGNRKLKGLLLCLIVLAFVFFGTLALQIIVFNFNKYLFIAFNIWFLSTDLAEKSLYDAGQKPKIALLHNDLEQAREETGKIVSRDTGHLSKYEVIRAVVESEAENCIDGVLAPLLYMLFGVILSVLSPALNPLVLANLYKAVNTMDSMVGYVNVSFKDFGFYPAKLDDVLNFIPARLGSRFMLWAGAFLGYDYKQAVRVYDSDRFNSPSPNAGHPEAAVAGLLGIQLGGPNVYFGQIHNKKKIGKPLYSIELNDIDDTMNIVLISEILLILGAAAILLLAYGFLEMIPWP